MSECVYICIPCRENGLQYPHLVFLMLPKENVIQTQLPTTIAFSFCFSHWRRLYRLLKSLTRVARFNPQTRKIWCWIHIPNRSSVCQIWSILICMWAVPLHKGNPNSFTWLSIWHFQRCCIGGQEVSWPPCDENHGMLNPKTSSKMMQNELVSLNWTTHPFSDVVSSKQMTAHGAFRTKVPISLGSASKAVDGTPFSSFSRAPSIHRRIRTLGSEHISICWNIMAPFCP